MIYHITQADAWQKAQQEGSYRADSLESEGFIHCSNQSQVAATANRYYRGQNGLVVLEIDENRLQAPLLYEVATGGERYPHIYGPLNLDAVVGVHSFPPKPDGSFSF